MGTKADAHALHRVVIWAISIHVSGLELRDELVFRLNVVVNFRLMIKGECQRGMHVCQ
jgi:hypothetical protein